MADDVTPKHDGIVVLDDATRPPPPEFTAVTAAQRLPGRHLAMIHGHFRDNMAVLRGLIDEAAAGAAPGDIAARAEALPLVASLRRFGTLCGQHCRIIEMHHSIEDEYVFPDLRERSPALRRVVDRLVAEHEVIHELLVRLLAALDALASEPGAQRFADARLLYDTLERLLLSHFGYEERGIGDALGVYGIGV